MNFTSFRTALEALEKSIAITSPAIKQVKRVYWGAPPNAITDLPCVVNALSESDRQLGFGSRDQRLKISVQLLAAKALADDAQSSIIATAMWFAAKDAFDADLTISGTVSLSVLQGNDPTAPVLLNVGGIMYYGFDATLEVQDYEAFTFG